MTQKPSPTEEKTGKWDTLAEQSDEMPEVNETSADPEAIDYLSMDELRAQLLAAENKASELQEQLLRTKAEGENLRRRTLLDIETERKFGLQKVMQELLPVLDNLERSLEACAAENTLREGVALTLKSFQDGLKKFGLKEVPALGISFDPHLHEAVSTQEQPDTTSGTILAVLQKGYLLHDRLIRPAMVVVAK